MYKSHKERKSFNENVNFFYDSLKSLCNFTNLLEYFSYEIYKKTRNLHEPTTYF